MRHIPRKGPSSFWHEEARLDALYALQLLDTPQDKELDGLAELASQICGTPFARISLVDRDRQWFKSRIGLDVCETSRDEAICSYAICEPGPFIVPDLSKDPRFVDNPSVKNHPRLRFYAGVKLETDDGLPVGMLCVLDDQPRLHGLTKGQAKSLTTLAHAVMSHLKLRLDNAELALKGKTFRTLTDSIPQMVWSARQDGQIDYCNNRWHDYTGIVPGSVEAHTWSELVHQEDRSRVAAGWLLSVNTGQVFEVEYRLRHHSGEFRWVLGRALPIRKSDGTIQRWFGTSTDIHAGKCAEAELHESEARYRALIEASATVVWTAAPDGSILAVWGDDKPSDLDVAAAKASGWLDAVHPDDRDRVASLWAEVIASRERGTLEYRIRRHGHDYRWVLARAVPLKDGDGRVREWVGTLTDIHEKKQIQVDLEASEEQLRLAVETTLLGIWDYDPKTGRQGWSPEACGIVGLPSGLMITHEMLLGLVHEQDWPVVEATFCARSPVNAPPFHVEFRIVRSSDGSERWISASGRTIFDPLGNPVRKIGTVQDITDRKQSEAALRANEERLRLALSVGHMVAWERDLTNDFVTRSETARDVLGIGSGPYAEFLGRVVPEDRPVVEHFITRPHASDPDMVEFRYQAPSGETLWLGERAGAVASDRLIGVTFDITDRKNAEQEIWRSANHDPLTGLPNRILFQHRLEQELANARQSGERVALLIVDLDDFKEMNDTLGHDGGDALLVETASRLKALVGETSTTARLGGDEFAILLHGPLATRNIQEFATYFREGLRKTFKFVGRTLSVHASVGFAIFPEHAEVASDLMKNADIALYQAKSSRGRSGVAVYSSVMRQAMEERMSLIQTVREGVASDEFAPFYQPKICLFTGKIIGLEALARWRNPHRGILTPAVFGAAFDDHELSIGIGQQILRKVLSDMGRWLQAGYDIGRVAFNLSSAEFSQSNLVEYILQSLENADIPKNTFEIEVTETVLLGKNTSAVKGVLRQLHAAGVRIALDDFGTGFASLTHLKEFPVDHIKIDRSFVSDLDFDADSEAIVAAVAGLGHSLHMVVTAEGIETLDQAVRLRDLGCDYGQGYLFAEALPASQICQMFERGGLDVSDFLLSAKERVPKSGRMAMPVARSSYVDAVPMLEPVAR